MYQSTITSKGQTTIPIDIRKKLNLITGDNIEYYANDDGTITIVHSNNLDITQLCGIMKKPNKIISVEEMDKIIAKRRADCDRD